MGDLRGRIHVAKQDLSRLQRKKVKGLRGGQGDGASSGGSSEGGDSKDDEEAPTRNA